LSYVFMSLKFLSSIIPRACSYTPLVSICFFNGEFAKSRGRYHFCAWMSKGEKC
jgi:hypothetical protein